MPRNAANQNHGRWQHRGWMPSSYKTFWHIFSSSQSLGEWRCSHARAIGKSDLAKTQWHHWTMLQSQLCRITPQLRQITPTLATIAPKYGATTQQALDTFDWPDRGCAKKQHGCPCIAYQSWTTREPQLSVGVVRSTTSLQWVKIVYYQWIGFVGKNWNRKAPWSSWENLWFPKFPVSIFPTKPIHWLLGLGWSEALKNTPSGSFFWATHMNHIIPIKSL